MPSTDVTPTLSKKLSGGKREMPVRKNKGGYQFGSAGKIYRGKGAKAKAAKQGQAIHASKNKK
jgi:hypothetical protein